MAYHATNGYAAIPELFANDLPQEASEADIKEYFSSFGVVTSVNLEMNTVTGLSRCFASVAFDSVDTLNDVLAKEHAIKGKKVGVEKAASKQGKIYRYLGKFTNAIYTQYVNVVEIRSKNENFCFLTFDKEEFADSLLNKGTVSLNGQTKKVTLKNDAGGMRGGGGYGANPSTTDEVLKCITVLGSKIDSLESKIDGLESKLNSKIDSIESKLNSKIDGIESKLNSKINALSDTVGILTITVRILASQHHVLSSHTLPFLIEDVRGMQDRLHNLEVASRRTSVKSSSPAIVSVGFVSSRDSLDDSRSTNGSV